MSVLGETMVDGEEFSVMDVVISFGFVECLGMEAHGNVLFLVILLGKDPSHGERRGIYL